MSKGRIIKAMSGFYYVEVQGTLYECKGRGVLKKDNIAPMIGDFVEMTLLDEDKKQGVIEKIFPRKNSLIRPPIANVTKALLVFGVKDPDPNLSLIDRFIVLAQKESLEIVLCFNKIDLDEANYHKELEAIYERVGYRVLTVSVKEDHGIERVKEELKHNITVIAGPSGVGKSSLINALDKRLNLKTSQVSRKLGRGRHTTRYAQLIDMGEEALVADTPGFSSLNLDGIEESELKEYFIEFHEHDHDCKFGFKCFHENEPGCQVKRAVEDGELPQQRYQSYLRLLQEVRDNHRRKY